MLNKLTYKWNDNNTLTGFIQFNHQSGSSDYFPSPEVSTRNRDPQLSWNTTWISIFTPNTSLEARIGGFYDHYEDIEDKPDLPAHLDETDCGR